MEGTARPDRSQAKFTYLVSTVPPVFHFDPRVPQQLLFKTLPSGLNGFTKPLFLLCPPPSTRAIPILGTI